MRIGLDIDGVFADFNVSFIERCISITGVDRFPVRPFDIPTWDYPQHYGYTAAQTEAVWENITADPLFWASLSAYPWTQTALLRLNPNEDDIYFVTSRPGVIPKQQTEAWLLANGGPLAPTVLISSLKGECALALQLDVYIDDRDKNVYDVMTISPKTRTFLLDKPWNRGDHVYDWKGIERVSSPLEMLDRIGR